jgi:molecular chaperone HscC
MFEALSQGLISKLREPVLRALRDGAIRVGDIHSIVLAGGATRMPVVRKAVATMFGRFPSTDLNPDEVVALGAAIQAGLKSRDAALREVVVTDVCPHSLGIDIAEKLDGGLMREGVFSPIIERNTIIPASRSKHYVSTTDGQLRIRFGIYQGESRLVKDNVRIGELEVPIPPGPAGSVTIECRFSYDINGLLEVDATVPDTGVTRQAVVLSDGESISPADLAQRRAALAKLKVNPKDQDENSAACARAERCYEQYLGETRERIGELLHHFESALAGQDPREIERARVVLHAGLDEIEGERYL